MKRKIKRIRRHFGLAAPKVVIRAPYSPWWGLILGGLIGVLAATGSFWLAKGAETEVCVEQINRQLSQFCDAPDLEGREGAIERAAQRELKARIFGVEAENAVLREELKLFEHLATSGGAADGVRIASFKVYQLQEGRYRYRLWLSRKSERPVEVFRGRYVLKVQYEIQERVHSIQLPDSISNNADYALELKGGVLREGEINVPKGARIKAVEVQVFQGATLRAEDFARF